MKVALPITVVLLVAGCAGNQALEQGVAVTNIASETLLYLDRQIAPLYETAAESALAALPEGSRMADYDAAMATWDRIETWLRTAHRGLLGMQEALKSWNSGVEGSETDYRNRLACVIEGFSAILEASDDVGVEVPPSVARFIALGSGIAGTCDEP